MRLILPLINAVILRDTDPSALWARHYLRPRGKADLDVKPCLLAHVSCTCPSAFPEKKRAEPWVHPEAGLEKGSNLGGVPTREPSPVLHRALARRAVWWHGGVHECPLIHGGFPLSLMGSAMAETTAPSCVSAWSGEKI